MACGAVGTSTAHAQCPVVVEHNIEHGLAITLLPIMVASPVLAITIWRNLATLFLVKVRLERSVFKEFLKRLAGDVHNPRII